MALASRFPARRRSGKPLVIDKSGPYWFELRDREGLTGGLDDRWEIEAVGDQPPSVSIERPSGNLQVTPGATVDAANRRERRSGDSTPSRCSIVDRIGPTWGKFAFCCSRARKSAAVGRSVGFRLPGGARVEIPYAWEARPLGLRPGTNLVLSAAATDYFPQTGNSSPRRITIIGPEQFDEILTASRSCSASCRESQAPAGSPAADRGAANAARASRPACPARCSPAPRR